MSDAVVGIACALGSVALFGTNYLPVKRYDVGDGFFFQWCLCLGIWLVGLAVDLAHVNSAAPPPFEPLAVLGGALWCTGQLTVVTIVQTIGIAKGLIVWGSTAMLAGWACGVFGLLGVRSQAEAVHSWPLNLGGLALCLLSLCTSLLLRPTVDGGGGGGGSGGGGGVRVRPTMLEERLLPSHADDAPRELDTAAASSSSSSTTAALSSTSATAASTNAAPTATASSSSAAATSSYATVASAAGPAWLRAMDREQRSAVGVGLALLAGVFFGTTFNPSQYVIDCAGTAAAPHASRHGLDYVHAQFSGIALASTVYFGLYCAYMRNRPVVLPQVATALRLGYE